MSAINVVAKDWNNVNHRIWSAKDAALIRTAAQEPLVERVFVNPAIKKQLCETVQGDRSWLHKVRPYWGHHDHIHVRISCPQGQAGCRTQAAPPPGDGCGKDLAWWFSKEARQPPKKPGKKPRPVTLADLPAACHAVLDAPGREPIAAVARPAAAVRR
jgi:penicillin-insensitive murein endopeptidase